MNETDEGAIAEAALQLAELGSLRLLQAQNPSPPLHPFLLSLSHPPSPCLLPLLPLKKGLSLWKNEDFKNLSSNHKHKARLSSSS